VVDLWLHDGDGPAMVHDLRRDRIPVLVLSSDPLGALDRRLRLPREDVLVKPFSVWHLAERLQAHVRAEHAVETS
jgi:DNA-binding response OmpR family regulator